MIYEHNKENNKENNEVNYFVDAKSEISFNNNEEILLRCLNCHVCFSHLIVTTKKCLTVKYHKSSSLFWSGVNYGYIDMIELNDEEFKYEIASHKNSHSELEIVLEKQKKLETWKKVVIGILAILIVLVLFFIIRFVVSKKKSKTVK